MTEPLTKQRMVECCVSCGQPKFPQREREISGPETENDWPACVNPECDNYGNPCASATWVAP
jgi:hypothetical protein